MAQKMAAQRLGADRPRQKSFAEQSAQGNWLSSRASIPAVPGSIPGADIPGPASWGGQQLKIHKFKFSYSYGYTTSNATKTQRF